MIEEQEAALYIRLTLKQWGMSHIPFSWTDTRRTLGVYYVREKRIELSRQILNSFPLFKEVFLHELAHALQYQELGGISKTKNGRNNFHGNVWKKWCARLKIPARRLIPA